MILALLFDHDTLVAAAPACDQRPHGNRFWLTMYPTALDYRPTWETAYVDVRDPTLANSLLSLAYDNRHRTRLQAQVDLLTTVTGRPRAIRAA